MEDIDPMLGDAEEQAAYIAKLTSAMHNQADQDQSARRSALTPDPSPTVLVGLAGFGDGTHTIE